MKSDTIPRTLPSRENTCLKCGLEMSKTVMEHVVIRTCLNDGYESRTVTGETKATYAAVIGSFTVTRGR